MKLTNFTEIDIKNYLSEIKNLIENDCFNIECNENREENIDFIEDYNIISKKQKEILLSLVYTDFCYAANNNNPKFAHEILYIFNKVYILYKNREDYSEKVDIYIKTK
ncbi:MAG: hypothetical protein KTQ14_11420 [Fusobacteriaceae bacterium]|nr:hypothetical protein [Fusobacteriaceae bacterium]